MQSWVHSQRSHSHMLSFSHRATRTARAPLFVAALLLAGFADWVDLDGPLLLARDRDPPLTIADGWISPPAPELWG